MLACVKNGVQGKLIYEGKGFELWSAPIANKPGHSLLKISYFGC
jgi:hypothetical protein